MEPEIMKQMIADWIKNNKQDFYHVIDELWAFPELGMEEYKSSELITKLLEKYGFTVTNGVAGMPTAFIAEQGAGRPVISFSSEFDALPGLSQDKNSTVKSPLTEGAPGHGCGHNLLSCGGILAAAALIHVMKNNGMEGTVKIFGTPAEELCIGKPFMARAGFFDNVDCFLDWHPMTMNRAGFCDSSAYFNIKYHFQGKTAHGNAPWHGRSALDGALLMGQALEFLREHIPPGRVDAESTLNYSFPNVGSGFPNVIPDTSTVWCIGRMVSVELVSDTVDRVDKCAEGAAIATGTTVQKETITITHEKIPNETLSKIMFDNFNLIGTPQFTDDEKDTAKKIQNSLGVPETGMGKGIDPVERRNNAVTDASEYSWFAPMELLLVELVPEGVGWHNWIVTKFAGSETGKKTVMVASKVLAATAADLLVHPELLKKAKDEWLKRLGGRKYSPLFVDDIVPSIDINKEAMSNYR